MITDPPNPATPMLPVKFSSNLNLVSVSMLFLISIALIINRAIPVRNGITMTRAAKVIKVSFSTRFIKLSSAISLLPPVLLV